MSLWARRAIALPLALAATTTAAASGFTVRVPDFGKDLAQGEQVRRLAFEVECLEVTDIRQLPPGWSLSVRKDGERQWIEIEALPEQQPWPERKSNVRFLDPSDREGMAFRLAHRGQWSDCASVRMTVTAQAQAGSADYSYDYDLPDWRFEGRQAR